MSDRIPCGAPGCHNAAEWRFEGTDPGGKPFVDYVCGCALGYLCEGDPDGAVRPVSVEDDGSDRTLD